MDTEGIAKPSAANEPPQAPSPAESTPPEPILRKFLASPGTWVITAANIALFAIAESHGRTTDVHTLLQYGALERSHVWAGEYWRLASSMFLHIGPIHLIWSVYAMPGWCTGVERRLGTWRFVVAYLLTGIGASATSLLCHHVIAAGASGAGFGMIGVTLVLAFLQLGTWKAFFANPGVKQILQTIVIWTAIGFTLISMDNYAHMGGFVFGLIVGWLLIRKGLSRRGTIASWTVFAALLAGTVVAAVYPKQGDVSSCGYAEATSAYEAYSKGDHAKSLELYDKAASMGYNRHDLYFNRGSLLLSKGECEKAVADFTEAIRLQPEVADGYVRRGFAELRMSRRDDAMADIERALKIDPRSADAYYCRGCLHREDGDLQQAAADFEKALQVGPADWHARKQVEQDLESAGRGR